MLESFFVMEQNFQEKIPYLDHLSFSSLKLFIQCPRRFFGEKLYREASKVYGIEVIIGSGVHKGLELFFERLKEGKDTTELMLEKVIYNEIDEQEKNANQNECFFQEQEILYAKKIALDIVYRNLHNLPLLIGDSSSVFGTELEIKLPVDGFPQYKFECHIDLVTNVGDVYTLWDYKTVKKFWDASKKSNLEEYTSQLLLYKYFFHKQYGIPAENIRTFFVFFKKTNFSIEKWMSFYTKGQLNLMLSHINNACNALEEKQFPYIFENRAYKCKFCQFYKNNICELESVDTKQYILNNYIFPNKEEQP